MNWNLHQIDALDKNAWARWKSKFDHVIGNPPYVRVQHLEKHRRDIIRKGDWRMGSGSCDLYLLFFEMGLELLRDGGKPTYITPNSWLKSRTGKQLRDHLRSSHQICCIHDFMEHQVFDEVTTYTSITNIIKNAKPNFMVKGKKCVQMRNQVPNFIDGYMNLDEKTWSLLTSSDMEFIEENKSSKNTLADVADIHVGIQTLADDVFIFHEGDLDVEGGITRKVYKASGMKNGKDKSSRLVIYPYIGGRLINEETLHSKFPKAYAWLRRNKERLLARDKGTFDQAKWYAFGRDVSITTGFGKKILTSGMNPTPNFQYCNDADSLFYSGYCVKPHNGIDHGRLLNQLNSDKMSRYISLVSRQYRNGWYSYAKSFIQSFPVTEQVYSS